MMVRLGVSILAYAPWCAWDPVRASGWAKEDGFVGLQMMPLQWFQPTHRLALPVWTVEDVWCPVPDNLLFGWVRAKLTQKVQPRWIDLALFPWRKSRQELLITSMPSAWRIDHSFENNRALLLEAHPGLWKTPEELLEEWGYGFVLDTYHLRHAPYRDHRHQDTRPPALDRFDSRLGAWQRSVDFLADRTKVVHVQPYRETYLGEKEDDSRVGEIQPFLRGDETELAKMITYIAARVSEDVWWILEVSPFGLNPRESRVKLRQMRELVEELINE